MGADLILKYKDEDVANLGKAYHFLEAGSNSVIIDDESLNEILDDFKTKLVKYAAYSPKSIDKLNEIIENVKDLFYDFSEEVTNHGRISLLKLILKDNNNFTMYVNK